VLHWLAITQFTVIRAVTTTTHLVDRHLIVWHLPSCSQQVVSGASTCSRTFGVYGSG